MAERGKIKEYRRVLEALAKPGTKAEKERRRKQLEGKAAKLGIEIHGEERAAKPRALSSDTDGHGHVHPRSKR